MILGKLRDAVPSELGVRSGCPGPWPIQASLSLGASPLEGGRGGWKEALLKAKASPVSLCPAGPAFFSPSFATAAERTRPAGQPGEEQRSRPQGGVHRLLEVRGGGEVVGPVG